RRGGRRQAGARGLGAAEPRRDLPDSGGGGVSRAGTAGGVTGGVVAPGLGPGGSTLPRGAPTGRGGERRGWRERSDRDRRSPRSSGGGTARRSGRGPVRGTRRGRRP